MKIFVKVLGLAAVAGAALSSIPASAEYIDGQLVRVIIYPDGTTVY